MTKPANTRLRIDCSELQANPSEQIATATAIAVVLEAKASFTMQLLSRVEYRRKGCVPIFNASTENL